MFHSKRFQFFESELITQQDPNAPENKIPHQAFTKLAITCCTSGRGNLMFGDKGGYINLVDRDINVKAFPAFKYGLELIYQMKQQPFLVGLGSDDEGQPANTIRMWTNLESFWSDSAQDPPCLINIILMQRNPNKRVPPTCFSIREDLSSMAVGFDDGTIVLVFNDIMRSPKQKVIRSPDQYETPITTLGWKEAGRNSALFAVTTKKVMVFPASNFNEEEIDSHGCEKECGLMNEDGDLLVGRPEAIYFYSPEGRGPCLAFDGEKKILAWFRNNLIVVGAVQNRNTVNIYDMKNKFTAFTSTYNNVSHVVTEWGMIFILTKDGKAYQLKEADTQSKLEVLYTKHYYQLAINLASTQQYDYNSIVDIYRKYGDHLYGKGDYDGAINQYVKTIGGLEPSYVIRKFLDAQRIHNLTSYLQSLHELNRANADHTTLLLNCYTKLKDEKNLDEFIKSDSGYSFDVETAIKVCRQAGYYKHALLLARSKGQHEWYLKILLDDTHNYESALDYISTLPLAEAEKNMKLYGKDMMSALPERTTGFLMNLCTFYVPVASRTPFQSTSTTTTTTSTQTDTGVSKILADLDEMMAAETVSEVKARPEEFIHIFINNEKWLTKFLEYIVDQNDSINEQNSTIYDTLLELYVQTDDLPKKMDEAEKEQIIQARQEKAFNLLNKKEATFDKAHAMALCKQYNFKAGLLYLYDSLGMNNEIIEYHMARNEYDELIRVCQKYGKSDPNLYIQTLSYFALKDSSECKPQLEEVLKQIDKEQLLPPLLVLQILSQTKGATLELIKNFLVRRLSEDQHQISEVQQQIRENTKKTEEMKTEIENLRTRARIFKSNKCSQCSQPLDLPAVHFLCMHSYHARCMADENECWLCADDNKQVIEINRSLEANVSQHDQFFKQLKDSSDGFATAAEYFGRGIFNKATKTTSSSSTLR